MHGGDLLSTDNNDTSNEQNQFDYKATAVGTSRLGEIKAKDREVMAAGASALSKAAEEFHFAGCGGPSAEGKPFPSCWRICQPSLPLFPLSKAMRTPNKLSKKLNHSAGMGALTCIMLAEEVYGLKTEFRESE